MKILLITATVAEIGPSIKHIQKGGEADSEGFYKVGPHLVKLVVGGVGILETTYTLTKELVKDEYDLVIQAGIAGSFDRNIGLGSVVFVAQDRYGDLGAEDKEEFIDIFELGFMDRSASVYSNGVIENENNTSLPSVKGITVNTVAGNDRTVQKRLQLFQPQVESMEGIALHYVCSAKQVSYMQIRGISNYVEVRNKANWQIEKAIANMNEWLMQYLSN